MIDVRTTSVFDAWFLRLRDRQAKSRVLARIARVRAGNPGPVKPVGSGVSEIKLDFGPGYRLYFVSRGPLLIVLLAGGDKSTQQADITTAKRIAETLE